ncbi:isohexenylglutaconyl-CoA hydratase [Aquabacterium commune]|uniref:Isohexenylglutaconyl-CoA hydratase n=1 Tax=Aquabacterium commune TaxID=70586 RepID=A0A4R6R5P4_9BURK|nr:enoyl-CoA hydratase/isomerase family protein [Aquabacterium commune]TDP81240.1 isohexenylglutaconyl-CoA hydratase [Aquabacterium commune]
MTHTTLQVRTERGVCTLTLNRPEVRNAMSLAMVNELLQALQAAEQDPAVRAIVLRGAGGHFCAGGDISDMAQARMKLAQQQADAQPADPNPVAVTNAAFGHLCLAYARSPLPIVTVLEGTVMGGGFGLACVSDVSLALDTVSFRLPETSLGLIPAQIAPFLVERLGYAEAKRLAVTGAKVGAAEALTIRLVHEVHGDAAALDAALQRTLASVLACGPQAIAATKNLLSHARLTPPEQLINDAAALFARAVLSEEGQEGTGAFMQKRKPQWVPQEG